MAGGGVSANDGGHEVGRAAKWNKRKGEEYGQPGPRLESGQETGSESQGASPFADDNELSLGSSLSTSGDFRGPITAFEGTAVESQHGSSLEINQQRNPAFMWNVTPDRKHEKMSGTETRPPPLPARSSKGQDNKTSGFKSGAARVGNMVRRIRPSEETVNSSRAGAKGTGSSLRPIGSSNPESRVPDTLQLQDRNKLLEDEAGRLEASNKSLDKKLRIAQDDIEDYRDNLKALEKSKEATENKLQTTVLRNKSLASDLEDAREKLQTTASRNKHLVSDLEGTKEKLQTTVSRNKYQVGDLDAKLQALRKSNEATEAKLGTALSINEALEKDARILQADSQSLKNDLRTIRTQYHSLEVELQSIRNDHTETIRSFDNLRTKHESLQRFHEQQDSKLKKLGEDYESALQLQRKYKAQLKESTEKLEVSEQCRVEEVRQAREDGARVAGQLQKENKEQLFRHQQELATLIAQHNNELATKTAQHQQEMKNQFATLEKENKHLTESVKSYSVALMTRDKWTGLTDSDIKTSFLNLDSDVNELTSLTWTNSRELQKTDVHSNLAISLKFVRRAILKDRVWKLLHDFIFCSPFRIFANSGRDLETQWSQEFGEDPNFDNWGYIWPKPTVDAERFRYVNVTECYAALTKTDISPIDPRAPYKTAFVESSTNLKIALNTTLNDYAQLTDKETKSIDKVVRNAVKLWLNFGMQRYRFLIIIKGPKTTWANDTNYKPGAGNLSLVVRPEVRRLDGSESVQSPQDATIVGGCAGMQTVIPKSTTS